MTKLLTACSAAAIAACLAAPATAQVAGTYSGTAADGSGISFTVGTDPATNALALTAASLGYSAACKGESYTAVGGWGFGLTADITNRRVSYTATDDFFYYVFNVVFSADGQSATGYITTDVPALYPNAAKPTKALLCYTPKQSFTLSLQPAAAKLKPAMHGGYLFDRKGRIVGEIGR